MLQPPVADATWGLEPHHIADLELSICERLDHHFPANDLQQFNMHGSFLDNVDADTAANRVCGSRMQVDAAATVAINRGWRAFVEGINLTNSPVRYSQVETRRPVQVEYYEPVLRFGLRASF